jgi:hypothetical protein
MNPYRARKKIVAYAITSFLAFCAAALGLALGYSGLSDRHFLLQGERTALDICLNNLQMDCDPRQWRVPLIAGTVLLVLGLAFLVRLGTKLRRVIRSGTK